MAFRNVIPDITILGRTFVFSQSAFVQVYASRPNKNRLAVSTFDYVDCLTVCCKIGLCS